MRLLSNGFQDRLVMTASITLRKYDATACIIFTELLRRGSTSVCSANPLRIPRPKIDKLACQAQGVGIFASRINPPDAYCSYFIFCNSVHHIYGASKTWLGVMHTAHIHFIRVAKGYSLPRHLFYHNRAFLSSIYLKIDQSYCKHRSFVL